MVINSRPLSYMSADDIEEPLTTSHLMVGWRLMSVPDHIPDVDLNEFEPSPNVLTRRAKYLPPFHYRQILAAMKKRVLGGIERMSPAAWN